MKLLREPLLHFLVIGAVLFGVYQLTASDEQSGGGEIVVSAGQIASLEAIFSRTWQRPPTAEERQALVNDYIRDEVFYREAVAMQLDRDDAVIRRRLRQKMEFVADVTAEAEPTDEELKTFVAAHPAWFRAQPRLSFSHVYFKSDRGGGPNAAELERLRRDLNAGTADASESGDPFMSGSAFEDLSRSDIAGLFGEDFAGRMAAASPNEWQGPIPSAYGVHLVRVSGRAEARDPPFEKVRDAARREWLHERRTAANEKLYERLRSRYLVKVEAVPEAPGGAKLAEAAR